VKTKTAIAHFGSAMALAKALGLTKGAVSHWGEVIPEKNALKLERITDGKLVYDESLYRKTA